MAQNYAELRSASTDELVRTYDSLAHNAALGLGFYRDEIARRDAAEETAKIIQMTRQMRDLTLVVVFLTLVNVVLVAITLFS